MYNLPPNWQSVNNATKIVVVMVLKWGTIGTRFASFGYKFFHNVWWSVEKVHQKVGCSTNQKVNAPEYVSSKFQNYVHFVRETATYQTHISIFWSGTSLRTSGEYIKTNLSAPQIVKWINTPYTKVLDPYPTSIVDIMERCFTSCKVKLMLKINPIAI